MLLTPEYLFAAAEHITPAFLREKGITALALDVDNTLTGDESQILPPAVEQWLADLRAAGITLTVVSNNHPPRVEPFARRIGLDYVADAAKPRTRGLREYQARLGIPKNQMAMVGDQLFTDRLSAALFGIPCFVTVPRSWDTHWWLLAKRVLEKPFLRRYYRKGGKLL